MNFNKFANTINESLNAEEMEGRNPNASFADWKAANPELATGPSAYYHFKKHMKGGTTSVDKPVMSAPLSVKGAEKTQAAVDEFLAQNPEASTEEVVCHLKGLNSGPLGIKISYITTPKEVASMINTSKGAEMAASEEEPEFNPEAEKAAKMARLRSFFMKPKAERDRILASKRKAAEVTPKNDKDDEDEIESDPYVNHYVKAMKKSPYDADETDPVEVD